MEPRRSPGSGAATAQVFSCLTLPPRRHPGAGEVRPVLCPAHSGTGSNACARLLPHDRAAADRRLPDGPLRGDPCERRDLGDPARPPPYRIGAAVLAWVMAVHPGRGLDDPAASLRNHRVGNVLCLERCDGRHAIGPLLQRRHLHDHRLRRSRPSAGMAAARRNRSLDGDPDGRMVDRVLLRGRQPPL